jgi:regulator of protease activity HflC (stomatin/prohibitin superfamily)
MNQLTPDFWSISTNGMLQQVETVREGLSGDETRQRFARTTLRNIIGTLTLKSANSERGKINSELHKNLHEETQSWGIQIVRTELKEIDPHNWRYGRHSPVEKITRQMGNISTVN